MEPSLFRQYPEPRVLCGPFSEWFRLGMIPTQNDFEFEMVPTRNGSDFEMVPSRNDSELERVFEMVSKGFSEGFRTRNFFTDGAPYLYISMEVVFL